MSFDEQPDEGTHERCAFEIHSLQARLPPLVEAVSQTSAALQELRALVRGEAPALLDEDSGGDSRLDMVIEDALSIARAALATAKGE